MPRSGLLNVAIEAAVGVFTGPAASVGVGPAVGVESGARPASRVGVNSRAAEAVLSSAVPSLNMEIAPIKMKANMMSTAMPAARVQIVLGNERKTSPKVYFFSFGCGCGWAAAAAAGTAAAGAIFCWVGCLDRWVARA